jgi:proteasome lid subunit RPN8/RPN11
MIEIEPEPWQVMVQHAETTYPHECCGAMLGQNVNGKKSVTAAVPLENVFAGGQGDHYELRPEELMKADRAAREQGLDVI